MYFVFIVNPIAGEKDKKNLLKRMESSVRMSHHDFIKEETERKGHAKELAALYAGKYGSECVIVSCGGDGTIHEIVNGISGTDAKMLVLPLGTGNDFAKRVYQTKKPNVEAIMKRFGLLDGDIRFDVMPIDDIDVDGVKCVNVMSFGHDTAIETAGRKIAAKVPSLGTNAYNVAVVYCCLFKNMKYKLNVDFKTIEPDGSFGRIKKQLDYTLLAICNGSYYGGGYCPSPNAVLDDGVLELCYIDAVNIFQAAPIIPKYAQGKADSFDCVHTAKLVSGTVSGVKGTLPGNYDGENFSSDVIHFKVENKVVNLCLPLK